MKTIIIVILSGIILVLAIHFASVATKDAGNSEVTVSCLNGECEVE